MTHQCATNNAIENFLPKTLRFLKERKQSDEGFMGRSHALSASAIGLSLLAFVPGLAHNWLQSAALSVVILSMFSLMGGALVPDLDNTASTAGNSLGFVGIILSHAIRTFSVFLQTTIRTRRDDVNPNPHRGAAHTVPFAALVGFLVYLLTKVSATVTVPVVGVERTWGFIFGLLITASLLHMTLNALAKEFMKKLSKNATALKEIIGYLFSLAICSVLFSQLPAHTSFVWLGVSLFVGQVIHVLGDCFTVAGAPIGFPLSALVRGKFWWTTRFMRIRAGGSFENLVFTPLFTLLSIGALLKIVLEQR